MPPTGAGPACGLAGEAGGFANMECGGMRVPWRVAGGSSIRLRFRISLRFIRGYPLERRPLAGARQGTRDAPFVKLGHVYAGRQQARFFAFRVNSNGQRNLTASEKVSFGFAKAHPGLSLHRHRPIRRSSRLPAVRFPAPDSRLQSAGTRASLA